MKLHRIYRTKDGSSDFEFFFSTRPFSRAVRVYIGRMPSYGSRSADGHSTHRYRDVNGAPYICFDPEPTNMTDAFNVAKAWAERTLNYIRNGTAF